MTSQRSRLPAFGAVLLTIPAVILACGGRGPLDLDVAAYDALDAQPGTVERDAADEDARPRDGGKGKDAGKDAGSLFPGLPGFPGLGADAGPLGACFACAQDKCGTQVNACLGSPKCVQEGLCDVTTCLVGGATGGSSGAGGAAAGLQCFKTCGTDSTADMELVAAFTCVLGSCGTSCLSALTSLGGAGAGAGGLGALLGGP